MTQEKGWKRSFLTILAGQAVSLATSGILQISIIFYLTEKTGSALVLSLSTLVGFLPQALLGPFIGVWIDRMSRKRVMIGADLFVALAAGIFAAYALMAEPPVWFVFLILFLRSVGTAFHMPAFSAATPLLVPEDMLTKCTGYSQSVASVSHIISPAAGAFFYAVWPLEKIALIDIAGALIACISVAVVKMPRREAGRAAPREGLLREMREALHALREHKGLTALLWISMLYAFVYMPVSALFPLMSMKYFGGTAAHAAATEVVFAAGMLAGGLILGAWGGFKRRPLTLCLSLLLMGAGLAVSGLLNKSGFVAFAACCAVMGFSAPFYGVQTALYQEKIRQEYLGRVFSLYLSTVSLAMPLGLLFAGAFAEKVGVHTWFLISGLCVGAIALAAWLLPSVRAIDRDRR